MINTGFILILHTHTQTLNNCRCYFNKDHLSRQLFIKLIFNDMWYVIFECINVTLCVSMCFYNDNTYANI